MRSQRSLGQWGFAGGLYFVLVAVVWMLVETGASAQTEAEELAQRGQAIFQNNCAACHTVGAGVLVGPDLAGVTERREKAWLTVHIMTPSVHHDADDPIAVALREQFGMRMPDLGLTQAETEAVIAYLQAAEAVHPALPALLVPTLAAGLVAAAALTALALRAGRKKVEVRP
jgi:mono/diheme cytochrome c family protein